MDQLKTYAAPIIALVLLLVWFFVIQPKLGDGDGDAAADDAKPDAKSDAKSDAKPQ